MAAPPASTSGRPRPLPPLFARLLARSAAGRRLRGRGALRRLARWFGGGLAQARVGDAMLALRVDDPFQFDMAAGRYEPELEALIARVLRPGDAYVDVGAQLGYTAALACQRIGPAGRAILFEPDPRVFPRLEAHMASIPAGRRPRLDVRPQACSNAPATLEFLLTDTWGHSTVAPSGAARPDGVVESRGVEAVALDDALPADLGPIRLLKMDVEGHEVQALAGLQRRLSERSIDLIYVEKNVDALLFGSFGPEHVHALVARHGYVCYHDQSGAEATHCSLRDFEPALENLLFARDHESAQAAWPGAKPLPKNHWGFHDGELDAIAEQALDPESPSRRARRAALLAREGDLGGAVGLARELLASHLLEAGWLSGHVGFWLAALGRRTEAATAFREHLERFPTDEGARRTLAEFEKAEG